MAAQATGWAEKYLMERLARAGGDVDAVIAVHAADLARNGHTHPVIARELDVAGRSDEALRWVKRGIREAGTSAPSTPPSSTTYAGVTRGPPTAGQPNAREHWPCCTPTPGGGTGAGTAGRPG